MFVRSGRSAFVAGVTLAALGVGPAVAQSTETEAQSRAKAITTVVGAPASVNCAVVAAAGRFDDEAFGYCNRAIEVERLNRANRIVTLNNRGALYLRRAASDATRKRTDGASALADFDAVLRLDARNADGHLNRGSALVMTGEFGEAVAAFTEALGLGVRQPHKAYLNRGAARESLGDLRGAFEDYQTALAINPEWALAEAELARFVRNSRDRVAGRIGETPPAAEAVRAQ